MDDKLKKALEALPKKEREQIEKEARQAAFAKLTSTEQEDIRRSADLLQENMVGVAMRNKRRAAPFGPDSAAELLSKLHEFLSVPVND